MNVGFFPTPASRLAELADENGKWTKEIFGGFARAHAVNLVAGSSAVKENGVIYNRAYVFDRTGNVVASYDKIHGFSPRESRNISRAETIRCIFHWTASPAPWRSATMCGSRSSSGRKHWKGGSVFLPAAWPLVRKEHWVTLVKARAIENQMYVCAVNECGMAGETKNGGHSLLVSPWGEELCHLGEEEEIGQGVIDMSVIAGIREGINVFRDRRPELYKI